MRKQILLNRKKEDKKNQGQKNVSCKNKLQKEIQNLKRKIKIQEQKEKKKKVIQNTSFIRNKIICINTQDLQKNELERPLAELLSKKKNQEIFYTRETTKKKSVELSQPKTNMDFSLKKKSCDLTKKKKKREKRLVRGNQKNSLKNLIDQYQILKTGNDDTVLSRMKLQRMKNKIEEIYSLIETQINRQNKGIILQSKVLSRKKQRAAIIIQKHVRGFLTRKIFNQAVMESYQTLQEMEKMNFMIKEPKEKGFNLSKNMNIFTFAKQSFDYTQVVKYPIVDVVRFQWMQISQRLGKEKMTVQKLLNQEMKSWQQSREVVKQLEKEVSERVVQEDKIKSLFGQIKKVIKKNLNKIKKNQYFIEQIESKSISNRIFSKDQMDVWKESPKVPEIITLSHLFDKETDNKSETGFFFTDRKRESKKNLISCESHVSISKNLSKISKNQKKEILEKKQESLSKFSSFKEEDLDQNFNELECVEIPLKQFYNFDVLTSDEFNEQIIRELIDDILDETIWKSFIYFMHHSDQKETENSENTIYGIRTNSNAVKEYVQLLITYIMENELKTFYKFIKDFKSPEISNECNDQGKTLFRFNSYKVFNEVMQRYCKKFVNKQKDKTEIVWKQKSDQSFMFNEQTYLKLEGQILDNYSDQNIMEELFEMQRIYHRCLFDCFNEIILEKLNTKPLLLINLQLSFKKTPNKDQIARSFLQQIKNTTIDCSMMLCGIIREKEDSMFDSAIKHFSDSSFKTIRDEKLKSLLQMTIIDTNKEFKKGNNKNEILTELYKKIEDEILTDLIENFLHYQLIICVILQN